ncbi:hypothetical protein, partial [Gilvibacter sp.]|uniref:hypothetical protein n=1 Tax=Gilvibacter sp. TaxID=2729997 RepID=UPI0035BE78DC
YTPETPATLKRAFRRTSQQRWIATYYPDETKERPTASITKHAVKNSEIAEEFRRVLWFPA